MLCGRVFRSLSSAAENSRYLVKNVWDDHYGQFILIASQPKTVILSITYISYISTKVMSWTLAVNHATVTTPILPLVSPLDSLMSFLTFACQGMPHQCWQMQPVKLVMPCPGLKHSNQHSLDLGYSNKLLPHFCTLLWTDMNIHKKSTCIFNLFNLFSHV